MTDDFIAQRVAQRLLEPLGVPAFFIIDQEHGSPAIPDSMRRLAAEYAGAQGYVTEWGQIMEQTLAGHTAWRFVPVALWERFQSSRPVALSVPELVDLIQSDVIALVANHLRKGMVVRGGPSHSGSHPHSLLTLMLLDARHEQTVRRWIGAEFLPASVAADS